MAESKGFEPLRQGYPSTRFPIVLLRPLGQLSNMAPQVGFEPTTARLTAECSTTELLRIGINLATSYSHRGNPQLPSALKSLTSVFGMGTGVTSSLSSPNITSFNHYSIIVLYQKFCKNFFILSKLDNRKALRVVKTIG